MDIGLIKRSCIRQMKSRGAACILYAWIISMSLYIIARFCNLIQLNFYLSLAMGFGLILIVQVVQIMRFFHMIRWQEQKFGVCFSDRNAKPLWKNAPVVMTDDWLIYAGTTALYRGYIKKIEISSERRFRAPRVYCLTVNTTDNRCYRLSFDMISDCTKIKRWWKHKLGEKNYGL